MEDLPVKLNNKQRHFWVKLLHLNKRAVCRITENNTNFVNSYILVDTTFGKMVGKVLGSMENHISCEPSLEFIRILNKDEYNLYLSNQEKEKEYFQICRQEIRQKRLDMKLVSVNIQPDDEKIVFFFTADKRIDFRELVKSLAVHTSKRIDMRQIGAREESCVVGGIAECGRLLCCHAVNDKQKPVSIKMAKSQELSLTSSKISGSCGRLLCCLAYEYDYYNEERKNIPQINSKISIDGTVYRVSDPNFIKKNLILGNGRERHVVDFCRFFYDNEKKTWKMRDTHLLRQNQQQH